MQVDKPSKDKTEINDFLEDYENKNIYKCRKCQWQIFRKGDYICANPISEYINQDVLRIKGCTNYSNEHELNIIEDELTESLL